MRVRIQGLSLVLVSLTFLSTSGLTSEVYAKEAAADQPDVSGVWYTRWRIKGSQQSQWSVSDLPFTEYGKTVFDGNIPGKGPRETMPAFGNDPVGKANPAGLLRTLIYFRPWEFIQLPDRVIQIFDLGKHWRVIWTDGRPVPDEITSGPFWYGYSVGRWEGDTLVVTTNNLDGRQWIDEWGTPISEFDSMVEERWRRINADELEFQITMTDPILYSRPWSSEIITYERQGTDSPMAEPLEQLHTPMDEELFIDLIRDPVAEKNSSEKTN